MYIYIYHIYLYLYSERERERLTLWVRVCVCTVCASLSVHSVPQFQKTCWSPMTETKKLSAHRYYMCSHDGKQLSSRQACRNSPSVGYLLADSPRQVKNCWPLELRVAHVLLSPPVKRRRCYNPLPLVFPSMKSAAVALTLCFNPGTLA